jgi:hypothetical protein
MGQADVLTLIASVVGDSYQGFGFDKGRVRLGCGARGSERFASQLECTAYQFSDPFRAHSELNGDKLKGR